MSMTPEQILDAAAEHINDHGWCKDRLEDDEGRVCIQGAVRMAIAASLGITDSAVRFRARKLLATNGGAATVEAIRRCLVNQGDTQSPVQWNDNVCRDADEAVHLLKKAKEFL